MELFFLILLGLPMILQVVYDKFITEYSPNEGLDIEKTNEDRSKWKFFRISADFIRVFFYMMIAIIVGLSSKVLIIGKIVECYRVYRNYSTNTSPCYTILKDTVAYPEQYLISLILLIMNILLLSYFLYFSGLRYFVRSRLSN